MKDGLTLNRIAELKSQLELLEYQFEHTMSIVGGYRLMEEIMPGSASPVGIMTDEEIQSLHEAEIAPLKRRIAELEQTLGETQQLRENEKRNT